MRLDELDTRSRLTIAVGVGIAAALLVPGVDGWLTRGLVGWNTAVWLFLALDAAMMIRADHASLRRLACANAEDIRAVVLTAVVAGLASLAAMFLQLQAGKSPDKGIAVAQVLFCIFTAAGSWVLLAVLFTLDYASLYYRQAGEDEPGEGLQFPGGDRPDFRADYVEFLYFAFTIAAAMQTSDVQVTTREMRKIVLIQSVVAFAFNMLVLALSINVAAELFRD